MYHSSLLPSRDINSRDFLQQEQAETNRNGVRVPEEMVWFIDRTKQEATKGGGGAKGHESRSANRDIPAQL